MYDLPAPHPKDMKEDTVFSIHMATKLCMECYLDILRHLIGFGDTMYNAFGNTKFIYAALVNFSYPFLSMFYNCASANPLHGPYWGLHRRTDKPQCGPCGVFGYVCLYVAHVLPLKSLTCECTSVSLYVFNI